MKTSYSFFGLTTFKNSTRYSAILVCLLILSLVYSCKKPESSEIILDKNLIKSTGKYAELVGKRNDKNGSFSIEHIERNADILTISVKGGCKQDDFQVVWDGLTLLSYPAQIKLVLHNNGISDCEAENQFNITVNLTKIIGEHDPKDFVFHVANGSIQQDKSLNPDGSVSSK